jgi:hypothetical protein
MACPCKNKKNEQQAPTAAVVKKPEATSEKPVDSDDPLACRDCLDKHLGAAAEYAKEAEEDPTRIEEYRRAVGHMICAEDHARALGLRDFAARIRLARKAFQTSRKASDMEALLKENTSVGAIR